jgi:hypothetical protein
VDKLYKTAVDWWLQVMLALPMLSGSGVIVAGLVMGNDRLRTTGVLGTASYCLLLGGLVMPMTYVIRKGGLVIRFGMIRQRVPWDRVVDIVPSSSPISSPAMSLKRLDIRYRKGNGRETHTLISPTDRAGFVRDCAEASGRHQVDGDKLIEKPA